MPQNRKQGLIFGILMSVTMAYGMEVYNVAWKMGIPTMPGGFSNLTNGVFLAALAEASYMWLFVLSGGAGRGVVHVAVRATVL